MKKKIYLIPQTKVIEVEIHLMTEYSGTSSTPGDPVVGGIDNSDATNRSRSNSNIWDDEEECF